MVGVVLASHGDLVYGLKDTYNMVAGELPKNVKLVSLKRNSDVAEFEKDFQSAVESVGEISSLLVLTDLEGGSPYNVACKYLYDESKGFNTAIIAGINFPMLLEVVDSMDIEKDFEKLVDSVVEQTRCNIKKAEKLSFDNNDEEF